VNDKSGEAWLGVAGKGPLYGSGWEGRSAVLSDKKTSFYLMDVFNAGK
jgi:hypothetical protein